MYSNPRKVYLHSAISTTSHLYLVVVILSLLGYYIHTNSTNTDSHSRSRNCEFLGFFFCTIKFFFIDLFYAKASGFTTLFLLYLSWCFLSSKLERKILHKESSRLSILLGFLFLFLCPFIALREPLRSTDCFNGGRFKDSEIEQSEILESNPHSNRYKQ